MCYSGVVAGKRVHFVMPVELVERIDAALGEGVSRGEFVRRAVEWALAQEPGGVAVVREGARVPDPLPRPGVSAGQPVSRSAMFRRATQR